MSNIADLQAYLKNFSLSDSHCKDIYKLILEHVQKGLGKATNASADIKCYITYVHDLPTGEEKGQYLALDLGGTNFRVLLVTLKGSGEAELNSKIFAMSKEVITSTGEQLFDHIAECLDIFVQENKLDTQKLPLGFTFSFPCKQIGLQKGLLVRWTKGFSATGVVNQDVGKLLSDAIARHGKLRIEVMAILNDTTGTLMSCAHRNQECYIGLIVGTGTNACYLERSECVELLEPELRHNPYVIINCESGAFGDSGCLSFIQTEFDKEVDKASINPGKQVFEKLISGMYLGELVRAVLIKAIFENRIFSQVPNKAEILEILKNKPECFETRMMSEIGTDIPPNYQHTKSVIRELLKIDNISEDDCERLHFISECITERSGHLCGILMSALINKIGKPKVVVGVDGSVYRFHPKFDAYMRETMTKLVDPKSKFDIMLSEDGSGRGAALVAAVSANKK